MAEQQKLPDLDPKFTQKRVNLETEVKKQSLKALLLIAGKLVLGRAVSDAV